MPRVVAVQVSLSILSDSRPNLLQGPYSLPSFYEHHLADACDPEGVGSIQLDWQVVVAHRTARYMAKLIQWPTLDTFTGVVIQGMVEVDADF